MAYDFKSLTKQADEASNRGKFYTDFEDVDPNVLHQISDLTEWIRTKGKGSDVREVIAQLFERTWLEATKEGNSNMEVAQARGMFNFLYDRLANIDAQLEGKADAGEIATQLQNMASASPKGTFANIAALRQAKPNGDTGTYLTTDNKNWNYWNGSSWVAGGIYQSSAVSPYDTFAFVAGDKPINFNNSSKIIEITGNNTYLVQGQVYAIVKESVPYPTSSAWIVIDTTTKRIKSAGNPTATDIIVGAIFNPDTASPKITFNGMYSIDSLQALTNREVIPFSQYSLFTNNANIVFDSKRNVLKFPQTNVIMGSKENWVQAQELQLSGSAGYILFNTANNKFEIGAANRRDLVNVVGYYHLGRGYVHLNTTTLNMRMKKIACLGDSITEGVNAGGWQWHRYIDQWCKNNGIESTVVNLGIGGTSVCTSSYVTDTLQPFVNRLDTIPSDADVVVIFGGTNDWGNNATLGTIDDTGTSTFYGAYKHILEWLAINRPNAKVMTMTPLKRYYRGGGSVWVNAQTTPNNKGNLLQDYVRAVKEVSDLYAVPCVDLHNDSGLNPVLEAVRTKFIGDGLHPTAEGNKKMYPVILDKMRPLLEYD
ncbi:TPA: SGNH/GDSL hydrolase family protein [Streptococcus suis]